MRMSRMRSAIAIAASVAALTAIIQADAIKGGFAAAWGPLYDGSTAAETQQLLASAELRPTPPVGDMVGRVKHWNEISIDASGLDHTPVAPGDPRVFGEQLGPGRSARAMAIVHIAIFEVVNSVMRRLQSYSACRARRRARRSTPRSRRRRTTRWPRCSPRRGPRSARSSTEELAADHGRPRRSIEGHRPREGGGARDPRAHGERRLESCRAARRHRLHHEQPAGPVAAGSDQPDPARARRELGRRSSRSS